MVFGLRFDGELRRVLDQRSRAVPIPLTGVLLTDRLAEWLQVNTGDSIRIEALTGERRKRDVVVAGTIADLIGLAAYMEFEALGRVIGEVDMATSLSVTLDGAQRDRFFAALKSFPQIATVSSKRRCSRTFAIAPPEMCSSSRRS